MKNIAFGKNLKELRKSKKLSRAKFAEIIAYSEKSVEKWEIYGSVPPLNTICKIADYFEITVDSLIYTENEDVKYLLGIDGGSTKTEFLLTDINKNPIKRIVLGPSNPVDIGIANTCKVLDTGINDVCKGISKREISAFIGISGGITGDNKNLTNRYLSKYDFAYFNNGSDTENALELALHGEDGVAMIIGTGIMAFAQKNGTKHRIGGWGYHLDKGGSGYNFGSDALCSALKCVDGRNGSRLMLNMIENRLGKELSGSIQEIYTGGESYIASFASIVFDAFKNGDAFAEEIINRNSKEIAEIITIGQKTVPNGKTVILGGLCNYSDILSRFIVKHLDKSIGIEFSLQPMVNGAVDIAKKQTDSVKNA